MPSQCIFKNVSPFSCALVEVVVSHGSVALTCLPLLFKRGGRLFNFSIPASVNVTLIGSGCSPVGPFSRQNQGANVSMCLDVIYFKPSFSTQIHPSFGFLTL